MFLFLCGFIARIGAIFSRSLQLENVNWHQSEKWNNWSSRLLWFGCRSNSGYFFHFVFPIRVSCFIEFSLHESAPLTSKIPRHLSLGRSTHFLLRKPDFLTFKRTFLFKMGMNAKLVAIETLLPFFLLFFVGTHKKNTRMRPAIHPAVFSFLFF